MPGGMGGGLVGLLTHGIGGMGGGPGGMGMQQSGQSAQTESVPTNEYDVDRWQRADGLDASAPTMVQAVRADWDQQEAEKKKKKENSRIRKFLRRFQKKNKKNQDGDTSAETAAPASAPGGGTIIMPEMKKAQRIHASEPAPAAAAPAPIPAVPVKPPAHGKNYLGLSTHGSIDEFFSSNPVNSALLASDSLSMGPLSLSQVVPSVSIRSHAKQPAPAPVTAAPAADIPGNSRNRMTQNTDVSYMNQVHESREQQKYNVRIV